MSAKHTPGPWRFHDMEHATVVAGQPGTSITIACCDNPRRLSDEESDANARLIAAAPDMLAALENALEAFNPKECNCDGEYDDGRLVGHACYFHRIEQDLKDAIAKATGGAE